MMPGEMYADFAAGLRDLVGRNKASERVLLAQFYRCLVKTTQKLVKQGKEPRTLEEAVDCPTEIDDPMDNVAQGMRNTGQPWATAPSPYLVPMAGMTGQTAVIPGIGGPGLPADVMALATGGTTTAEPLQNTIALFTNPQGVWNPYSATWDVPAGRVNEEDVVIGDEKRESGGNEDGVVEERGETASGAHEQVPRGQSCDGSKRTTHGGVVVGRVTGTAPKDFVDIKGCMDEEVEIRDNQRAGRYVATVRPALTSARYVRADARNAPAEMDEDEVLQTEEGVCVPKVVVSRNDDHWSDGESPDTATTSPGEDGVVAELRAARKLEKN
ncbi:hypothetical protein PC116_g7692 [Phytophthora cactorum]|uniref:Uncharacterized protein n=1 Tax=Phytophthora cactorum TaxID=29920 RepID=A0A8T1L4Q0_9STRA|nr:hypothetical protein PC112_g4727 [Phytophthora cactorum]KAG2923296.1 hypothetical protein PC114_g4844 [Phytophthora cactorum]KAG2993866.1 hypothetical protein PC118_g3784 [Phytophthora cactorum]KAG4244454.1 hypothetical protein PC116_g7692 [Phytophthora cactorum]